MGIQDLQEAWSRMSASSSGSVMLNEEQIRTMLGKQSKTLMEKIDSNIRTGFFILLAAVVAIFTYDIINTYGSRGDRGLTENIPGWLFVLDFLVNLLIVGFVISFYIRYFKIRRLCRDNCDMRHSLLKVIGLLTLYRRLFTMVLVIIMLTSATGFIAGYYTSIIRNQTSEGFLIPVIVIGLFLMALLTWLLFLLLRWVFRRIYGNYLGQLKETLAELEELE